MLAKNEPGATAVNVRLFNPNAATGGCFEDEFVSTAVRISSVSISTDDTRATPVAVRHIWPWLRLECGAIAGGASCSVMRAVATSPADLLTIGSIEPFWREA
jgi:hypothetical protein